MTFCAETGSVDSDERVDAAEQDRQRSADRIEDRHHQVLERDDARGRDDRAAAALPRSGIGMANQRSFLPSRHLVAPVVRRDRERRRAARRESSRRARRPRRRTPASAARAHSRAAASSRVPSLNSALSSQRSFSLASVHLDFVRALVAGLAAHALDRRAQLRRRRLAVQQQRELGGETGARPFYAYTLPVSGSRIRQAAAAAASARAPGRARAAAGWRSRSRATGAGRRTRAPAIADSVSPSLTTWRFE